LNSFAHTTLFLFWSAVRNGTFLATRRWYPASAYKSPMNSDIMNRDKSIGLQEVEQLIEKPVQTLLNQPDKIVYVAKVQAMWTALSWWPKSVLYHIASGNPESMYVFKCSL
jgi:hypothetical protein